MHLLFHLVKKNQFVINLFEINVAC